MYALGSYGAWHDAEARAGIRAESSRPAGEVIDEVAKDGNDLRVTLALAWASQSEDEHRRAVMVWMLGAANRIAERAPTLIGDFLDTHVADDFPGARAGQSYLLALVDARLAALKAIRREMRGSG